VRLVPYQWVSVLVPLYKGVPVSGYQSNSVAGFRGTAERLGFRVP